MTSLYCVILFLSIFTIEVHLPIISLYEDLMQLLLTTSIDSLQSRAEVVVKVVFGIYGLSKDETFNK